MHKNQFADYETSKMLKELGFDESCLGFYSPNGIDFSIIKNTNTTNRDYVLIAGNSPQKGISAPLWQQVEQWLWEKHEFVICIDICHDHTCTYAVRKKGAGIIIPDIVNTEDDFFRCDSPITAKIEGIKQAVKYLYEHK